MTEEIDGTLCFICGRKGIEWSKDSYMCTHCGGVEWFDPNAWGHGWRVNWEGKKREEANAEKIRLAGNKDRYGEDFEYVDFTDPNAPSTPA